MTTGLLFVQAVAFSVLSGIVASNKNRDAFGWGLIGFIFGLFGFIAAVVVREVEQEEEKASIQSSSTREFNPEEHDKKCPDCAEYIKLEASVCKHCGHEFSDKEVQEQVEKKSKFLENKRKRLRKRNEIVSRRGGSKEVSYSPSLALDSEEKKMIGFLLVAVLLFFILGSLLSYL